MTLSVSVVKGYLEVNKNNILGVCCYGDFLLTIHGVTMRSVQDISDGKLSVIVCTMIFTGYHVSHGHDV